MPHPSSNHGHVSGGYSAYMRIETTAKTKRPPHIQAHKKETSWWLFRMTVGCPGSNDCLSGGNPSSFCLAVSQFPLSAWWERAHHHFCSRGVGHRTLPFHLWARPRSCTYHVCSCHWANLSIQRGISSWDSSIPFCSYNNYTCIRMHLNLWNCICVYVCIYMYISILHKLLLFCRLNFSDSNIS